jgi:hypothetical protein
MRNFLHNSGGHIRLVHVSIHTYEFNLVSKVKIMSSIFWRINFQDHQSYEVYLNVNAEYIYFLGISATWWSHILISCIPQVSPNTLIHRFISPEK